MVVSAEHAQAYERKAPGRTRITTPLWHTPPLKNRLSLTTITVSLRPGQGEVLEQKLHEMRARSKHLLPGTAARYIARSQDDPGRVTIVFVWRDAAMPAEEVRAAALAAFAAALAGALD